MYNNIEKTITNFHDLIMADRNHRYRSWEHCYLHFTSDDAGANIDLSCLQLSFYLASWGMYRGSSFLLWKDYLIHKDVVKELIRNKEIQKLKFLSVSDADLKRIIDLSEWIKEWYHSNITTVNGEQKNINTTDTLVTKILLGTLGCIPAYDRYFIDGMRKSGIRYSKLSISNLRSIVEYYKTNHAGFIRAQKDIYSKTNIRYPAMKLMDMYFWEIGFQANN